MDGLLPADERAGVPDDALGDAIGVAVNRAIDDALWDALTNGHTFTRSDDDPSAATDY